MNQHVTVETTTHTRVSVDQSGGYDTPPPSDHVAANAVAMIGIIGLFLVMVAVVGLFIVEVLPDLLEFLIELAHSIAYPAAIIGAVVLASWLLVSAGNVVVDVVQAAIVIVTAPVWLPVVTVYHLGELLVDAIRERASRRCQSRLAEAQRPIIIMVNSHEEAKKLLAAHDMAHVRIVEAPAPKQLMGVK